jgi:hypothetical protein
MLTGAVDGIYPTTAYVNQKSLIDYMVELGRGELPAIDIDLHDTTAADMIEKGLKVSLDERWSIQELYDHSFFHQDYADSSTDSITDRSGALLKLEQIHDGGVTSSSSSEIMSCANFPEAHFPTYDADAVMQDDALPVYAMGWQTGALRSSIDDSMYYKTP